MSTTKTRVPRPGSPCPNGCAEGPRREVIVTLVMNEDREVCCPSCWDCFGILPAGRTASLPNRPTED